MTGGEPAKSSSKLSSFKWPVINAQKMKFYLKYFLHLMHLDTYLGRTKAVRQY